MDDKTRPKNRLEYEVAGNEATKRDSWDELGQEFEGDMQGTRKLVHSTARSGGKGEDNEVHKVKNRDGVLRTK